MANEEQLAILRQGVDVWNKWREKNPTLRVELISAKLSGANLRKADLSETDFSYADLSGTDLRDAFLVIAKFFEANLSGANLSGADLSGADLSYANLSKADFSKANLNGAHLSYADLREANLSEAKFFTSRLFSAKLNGANLSKADLSRADLDGANLTGANLSGANLSRADLDGANLTGANLSGANLNRADLSEADLTGSNLNGVDLSHSNLVGTIIDNVEISKSNIYGISVWDLVGEFKEQNELVITPEGESTITVDNIEIAQFIYLILNNKKLRDVINTLTSKTVLILGRFAIPERKAILDALRNKLREYDLLPIVFDFDRPADKDFTETIKTLASISYFVIADVTNPKSSPLELQATVPDYQIPFVPIIQEGESPFAMMVDLQKKFPWVLPTRSYDSIETLMSALKPGIIDPAVEMRNKLRLVKAQEQVTESLRDYVEKSL